MLPSTFQGTNYRLANNWYHHVDLNQYTNRPIKYLEIGTFYGANLLSVARTYASHPESELYCIDPWCDYDDYPQYKEQQSETFKAFLQNIETSGEKEKIFVNRGLSHEMIPSFPNEFFDIIYVDGNHEPDYVIEDAVLSFRKLKKGGILIFDDYGWGGPMETSKGIDAFLSAYYKKINYLGERGTQVFVQKK